MGTDDGALWGTRDGGHGWQDLWGAADVVGAAGVPTDIAVAEAAASRDPKAGEAAPLAALVPGPRCVSSIEASRFADGRAYLTLDAHRSDDDAPYVFVTEDYGATWRSLCGDLPRGSTRAVREDLKNEDLLYLGTEFGFFVSIDRGAHWTRFHGELPTVAVHDFAQHPTSGELVLATHGRSLWTVDVTALRQMTADALAEAAHLFDPNDVVVWRTRHRRAFSGAREFVGENPSSEAEIFYRLERPARAIKLSIVGLDGKEVRVLEADGAAGLHKVVWDLRPTPSPPSADGARGRRGGRGGFGGFRGRSAEAGTYRAVLEVDGAVQEQRFDVLADPTLGAPAARGSEAEDDGGR